MGSIEAGNKFTKHHSAEVVCLSVACNGKYLVTCSNKADMVVWNFKGDVLATVDTYHMSNYCAVVSPCCRFVGTSGFTPDAKVWEVSFTRSGEFDKIIRAFDLKSHNSGVTCLSFNTDSSRVATISKDGTWKIFDTNVEYSKGQEPYLLVTGSYELVTDQPAIISLAPDGRVVVVASGNSLIFYSAMTGEVNKVISAVHTDPISSVIFDPMGRFILSTGDKVVRIFHNIPGYRFTVNDLEEKKKKASTTALKERLEAQIQEAKKALKVILNEG